MSCGFPPIKLQGFNFSLDDILGVFGLGPFSVKLSMPMPSFDESMNLPGVKLPGFSFNLDDILGVFGLPGFSLSMTLPEPKCPLE